MDSRYWVCPSCFCQFDWESQRNNAKDHDIEKCKKRIEKQDHKEEAKLNRKKNG